MVMNGRVEGTVSEATRARVLQAADELGYTRSAVALSLKNRRTKTLGLITDEISTSPFAGRMVRAASAEAAAAGYMVITVDLSLRESSLDDGIRLLAEHQVEGLIYATMGRRVLEGALRVPAGLPLVLLNCIAQGDQDAPPCQVDSVVPDDYGGARRAAQRLLDVGHTGIVMLSGDNPADRAAQERERGFQDALDEAGLDAEIVHAGWQMNDGYREAQRLLATAEPPTALFCLRDRVAAGAVHAAAVAGRSVPEDLSVIGFDDEDLFAETVTPQLTTIALPHTEMGSWAMQTLITKIDSDPAQAAAPAEARCHVMACHLVERASVARPPAAPTT